MRLSEVVPIVWIFLSTLIIVHLLVSQNSLRDNATVRPVAQHEPVSHERVAIKSNDFVTASNQLIHHDETSAVSSILSTKSQQTTTVSSKQYLTVDDHQIVDMPCIECIRRHLYSQMEEPAGENNLAEIRARYLETVKSSLSGYLLQTDAMKMGYTNIKDMKNIQEMDEHRQPYHDGYRFTGLSWPAVAYTMAGMSIMARATLFAYNSTKAVYVADSFKGLPKARSPLDHDEWSKASFLSVPVEDVKHHFERLYLYDPEKVFFVVGYFNDTMPVVRASLPGALSILRLDGDMFESCLDIITNLYDKLSIGGWVVIDDWHGFPCKTAIESFRQTLNITEKLQVTGPNQSAFWQKLFSVTFDPADISRKIFAANMKTSNSSVIAVAAGRGKAVANNTKIMLPDAAIPNRACQQCKRVGNRFKVNGTMIDRVRDMYLETLKAILTGYALQSESGSLHKGELVRAAFNDLSRVVGNDTPIHGYARNGMNSLIALENTLIRLMALGDFVDAGVWRGGTSILAAAIHKVYGRTDRKVVIVDTFRGAPKSTIGDVSNDNVLCCQLPIHNHAFRTSSIENVKQHLKRFFVYDPDKTLLSLMPTNVNKTTEDINISVMRLDAAVLSADHCTFLLERLYARVCVSGAVFVDNWNHNSTGCAGVIQSYYNNLGSKASTLQEVQPQKTVWWTKIIS